MSHADQPGYVSTDAQLQILYFHSVYDQSISHVHCVEKGSDDVTRPKRDNSISIFDKIIFICLSVKLIDRFVSSDIFDLHCNQTAF